jgi:hypothetical protein
MPFEFTGKIGNATVPDARIRGFAMESLFH